MFILLIVSLTICSSVANAVTATDELLLELKNVADGLFPASLLSTGLNNENNPTENAYSIIGTFDASGLKDSKDYYTFKLVYGYDDGTSDILTWRQKNWLTDVAIEDADLTGIPDQRSRGDGQLFRGLARSTTTAAYLDGDAAFHGNWWNAVGTTTLFQGGIPAFNGKVAISQALYILDPSSGSSNPAPPSDPNGVLLLNINSVSHGYFGKTLLSTGLENKDDPSSNTYSIIGTFDASSSKDILGYYKFKLIYSYPDGSSDTLVWRQKNWLTDTAIADADLTGIPDQRSRGDGQLFRGLAISPYNGAYLDGDAAFHGNWWNAVGTVWSFNSGIPAFNGKVAESQTLFILDPSTGPSNPDPPSQSGAVLLLNINSVSHGYFGKTLLSTGLENKDDPSANTYSTIGDFDPSNYRDSNGYLEFKLIYRYDDPSIPDDILEWKQKNWLTDAAILDADLFGVPDQTGFPNGQLFKGLARSSTSVAYLDGDAATHGNWWNAVGTLWSFNSGIPAFKGKVASSESLFIIEKCIVDADCNDNNVCNGLEICVDDECQSPNDFGECPLNFICDPFRGCVRDCNTFAIDGYLQDCSAEFDTIKNENAALEGGLQDFITQTNKRLNDLEAFTLALGPNIGEGESDANSFNGPGEAPPAAGSESSSYMTNDNYNDYKGDNNVNLFNVGWLEIGIILVVALSAVNLILFVQNCLRKRSKDQYGVVHQYSSDDVHGQLK